MSLAVAEARPESEVLERIRTARRHCPVVHMREVQPTANIRRVGLEKTGTIEGI